MAQKANSISPKPCMKCGAIPEFQDVPLSGPGWELYFSCSCGLRQSAIYYDGRGQIEPIRQELTREWNERSYFYEMLLREKNALVKRYEEQINDLRDQLNKERDINRTRAIFRRLGEG